MSTEPKCLRASLKSDIFNGCSSGVRSVGVIRRLRLISGLWPNGSMKIATPSGLRVRATSENERSRSRWCRMALPQITSKV